MAKTAVPVSPPSVWHELRRCAWFLPVLLVAVLYVQVLDHWYVDFDDYQYTSSNSMVSRGLTTEGVTWAFSQAYFSNYHPLTWLSHMLDFDLFGDAPGWMALENAGLHAMNALLLALLVARLFSSPMTGVAVGCVFAVHPQLVEAVAWISQRKTLLATLFALLTMLAYLRAVETGPSSTRRRWWYGAALLAFTLSLLAKGMYVTMPAILLLLEQITPDGKGGPLLRAPTWSRVGQTARRLAPFLLLSVLFSVLTFWAQREGGAVSNLERISLPDRFATAFVGYMTYLRHFVFPTGLSIFYPHPGSWHAGPVIWAAALLVALSVAMLMGRKRWGLTPLIGWFLFIGMMLPVIGIVQVGSQSSADRYMYGPIFGLLIACTAICLALRRSVSRFVMVAMGSAFVLWLVFASVAGYRQISLWRNSYVLTEASLESVGPDPMLLSIQGSLLVRVHKFDEAIKVCKQALELWPDHSNALANLGLAEASNGNYAEGIRLTLLALEGQPDSTGLRINLAHFYAQAGREAEARALVAEVRSSFPVTDMDLKRLERIEEEMAPEE